MVLLRLWRVDLKEDLDSLPLCYSHNTLQCVSKVLPIKRWNLFPNSLILCWACDFLWLIDNDRFDIVIVTHPGSKRLCEISLLVPLPSSWEHAWPHLLDELHGMKWSQPSCPSQGPGHMREPRDDRQSCLVNSQLTTDTWMCLAKLLCDQQNWPAHPEAREQRHICSCLCATVVSRLLVRMHYYANR